jgi:signal transduction protein with GAF and PtsI domain
MVTDSERAGVASAGSLKARLSQSGLTGETVNDGISSILADPRRLQVLNSTGLMDTPPESSYSRLTRTAADALGAPVATLVLVGADRQFVKSADGVDLSALPKHLERLAESFDKYVVANGSLVRVDDARVHPLFKTYSVVGEGRVLAYLGMPLSDRAGNTTAGVELRPYSDSE